MSDVDRFDRNGFAITGPLLTPAEIAACVAAAERLVAETGRAVAGLRDVLAREPALRAAADAPSVRAIVARVLGPGAFVVRSILFDKTPAANWDVAWHQDVTVAVRERREVPGFGPWSVKTGVPHVQPPARVLARMVTVRLHLDDCGEGDGPLLVVPGSHARGVVDVTTLDLAACERSAVACHAPAGVAVVMRPLTLHASRKARSPTHRRVLHLEFAADPLPGGLEWARV